jgi:asparagine synthase (glutamine-hydrolysing)
MSGIVGIFKLDGQPVDRNDVARMVSTIERCGPDGSDIWSESMVGRGVSSLIFGWFCSCNLG